MLLKMSTKQVKSILKMDYELLAPERIEAETAEDTTGIAFRLCSSKYSRTVLIVIFTSTTQGVLIEIFDTPGKICSI